MGLDVSSHLHPVGSFNLSDHPVPTGREEVWRFTPLKRLKGIHKDAALDGDAFDVEISAAPGVSVERVGIDHESRGSSGLVPPDRVSARAWEAAESVLSEHADGRPGTWRDAACGWVLIQ